MTGGRTFQNILSWGCRVRASLLCGRDSTRASGKGYRVGRVEQSGRWGGMGWEDCMCPPRGPGEDFILTMMRP